MRGHVLPIGGVKEKVFGAHRAGIQHVILPAENEADLDDLPSEVRESLRVSLVRTLDEVFPLALLDLPHDAEAPRPSVEQAPAATH